MRRDPAVVCLSQINFWNDVPYPIHHMMKAMSRSTRVLWVNPTSVAFPSTKKKSFWEKALRRLRSHLRYFVCIQDDLFVFSPLVVPIFTKEIVYRLNNRLLQIQLKLALWVMRIKRPYIFVALPTFAGVALSLNASRIIYYISDKYSGYEHVTDQRNKEIVEQLNQFLMKKADYILFTARMFFDEMDSDLQKKSFFITHGVDVEFFQRTTSPHQRLPADLSDIPKPIIGYFGLLIKERCDMEIVRWCAEQRPDWSFIFIGKKWDRFPEVEGLNNVYFLGPKPHDEIPLYGQHFDVCIINRYLNEAVRYSNPTKVNEFLALGKPIVSVPIDHLIRDYDGLISIASDGKAFLQQIEFELKHDSPERISRRLDKVRKYSWDRMSEYVLTLFAGNTTDARDFFN